MNGTITGFVTQEWLKFPQEFLKFFIDFQNYTVIVFYNFECYDDILIIFLKGVRTINLILTSVLLMKLTVKSQVLRMNHF